MDSLDKILMYKEYNNISEINNVFIITKEIDNYFIGRRYDTLCNSYSEFTAIDKNKIFDYMYSAKDFFKNSKYIGEKGYFDQMSQLEKYVYKSVILLYKDEYNELLYDTIMEKIYVSPSVYEIENFVYTDLQKDPQKTKK